MIEEIRRAIAKEVIDPELHINIVDMGLVYAIEEVAGGAIQITMTLTSMGCPAGPQLLKAVHDIAAAVSGRSVSVSLVWDPPWKQDMLSADAKDELGIA